MAGSTFWPPTGAAHQSCRTGTTPPAPFPSATLPELFEAQVAQLPDATAVVFEDASLSYGRAQRPRQSTRPPSAQPRTSAPMSLVGLCVERSLDMLVGLLGILKAGGAYLPLDPAYPQQRLAFMLHDAKAKGPAHPAKPCSTFLPADRPHIPFCIDSRLDSHHNKARATTRKTTPPQITSPTSSTHQAQQEHLRGVALTQNS